MISWPAQAARCVEQQGNDKLARCQEITLSSYRLSETKEIRTLVHYHLATLKKCSPCCLVTMKNFSLS